jgi:hypothetical protein
VTVLVPTLLLKVVVFVLLTIGPSNLAPSATVTGTGAEGKISEAPGPTSLRVPEPVITPVGELVKLKR